MTNERAPGTAITGIGQSEIGRPSEKSAMQLTIDACKLAISDAGLSRDDIGGLSTHPGLVEGASGHSPVGVHELRVALGLKLDWYAGVKESTGQIGCLFSAMGAIALGLAEHVLVYRTICDASARKRQKDVMFTRYGDNRGTGAPRVDGMWQWLFPYNALSPATWFALYARRHFHQFGTRPEQLAQIALNARRNAVLNPDAVYRTPLTMADYMAAPYVADPLRRYDCDVPVDGSVALVLSRADVAKHMPNPRLLIEAIGSAVRRRDTYFRPEDLTSSGAMDAAKMMWQRTTLKPRDVDVAQLYDGFSVHTLYWLEALGFCEHGEGGSYLEGGQRISLLGELPLNTGGGQLSAGRLHGFGHIHEACMQLWGRGGARQVPKDARTAVVANGAAGFVGCMLVVRD